MGLGCMPTSLNKTCSGQGHGLSMSYIRAVSSQCASSGRFHQSSGSHRSAPMPIELGKDLQAAAKSESEKGSRSGTAA
eukprot:6541598-Pyramimonas_sp.AAC.1